MPCIVISTPITDMVFYLDPVVPPPKHPKVAVPRAAGKRESRWSGRCWGYRKVFVYHRHRWVDAWLFQLR